VTVSVISYTPAAVYVWLPVTVPGVAPLGSVSVQSGELGGHVAVVPSPQFQTALCASERFASVKVADVVVAVLTWMGFVEAEIVPTSGSAGAGVGVGVGVLVGINGFEETRISQKLFVSPDAKFEAQETKET
jgi:hypothetical protein